MITTVLFDLDGLLIDSERLYYRMADELVRPYGGSVTMEEYVSLYSGRTLSANVGSYLERFQVPMTVPEGMKWTRDRETELTENGIPLKAGAIELIRFLKEQGIKILLATSSLPDRAERFLKLNGIYGDFDDYVYGNEVTRSKPDPETFLIGAGKAGEIPSRCLVLEDSENGIRAAHAGGFHVICVPDLKFPSPEVQALADAVVKSLDEVIPLVGKL